MHPDHLQCDNIYLLTICEYWKAFIYITEDYKNERVQEVRESDWNGSI